MKKIYFICFIIFIQDISWSGEGGGNSYDAPPDLVLNTGSYLINAFQCDTMGSNSRTALNSLRTLTNVVDAIESDRKECHELKSIIKTLPDIDSIVRTIESESISYELKKQEDIVKESFADLYRVQNLPAEELDLYPSQEALKKRIVFARGRIASLSATLSVDQKRHEMRRYTEGIKQLDTMAQSLNMALNSNSKCLDKVPGVKAHIASGLMGIMGFFLEQPLGIATALSGKILQNVFSIRTSKQRRKRDAFNPSAQASIFTGLTCALQSLNEQHCKIIKQESLLNGYTEAKSCTECEQSSLKKMYSELKIISEVRSHIEKFNSWFSRKSLSKGYTGHHLTELKDKALNHVLSYIRGIESRIISGEKALHTIGDKPVSRKKEIESIVGSVIGKFNSLLYPNNSEVSNMLSSTLTNQETKFGKYLLVLKKEDQTQEQIDVLINEFNHYYLLGGQDRTPKQFDTFYEVYFKMWEGSYTGSEYKKIREKIYSEDVLDRIKLNLLNYKKRWIKSFSSGITAEDVTSLGLEYFDSQYGEKDESVLGSVKSIQHFMKEIDPEFKKSMQAKFLNLSSLNKKIDSVVKQSEDFYNNDEVNSESVVKLFESIDTFSPSTVNGSDGFLTLHQTIDSYFKFQTKKINEELSSMDLSSPISRNLLTLSHQDVLKDALNLSSSGSLFEKETDISQAKAISALTLRGFTTYFKNHLTQAMKLAEGKGFKGRKFEDGVLENLDDQLKISFCIHTLGLTTIPKKLKKFCKGVSVKSGAANLSYDKFKNLPHPQRVCSYHDFIFKEKLKN